MPQLQSLLLALRHSEAAPTRFPHFWLHIVGRHRETAKAAATRGEALLLIPICSTTGPQRRNGGGRAIRFHAINSSALTEASSRPSQRKLSRYHGPPLASSHDFAPRPSPSVPVAVRPHPCPNRPSESTAAPLNKNCAPDERTGHMQREREKEGRREGLETLAARPPALPPDGRTDAAHVRAAGDRKSARAQFSPSPSLLLSLSLFLSGAPHFVHFIHAWTCCFEAAMNFAQVDFAVIGRGRLSLNPTAKPL